MSHLWIENRSAQAGQSSWIMSSLAGDAAAPLLFPGDDDADAAALLLASREGDGDSWLLLCIDPGVVSLNGEVVQSGIRVLADRDEIRVAGRGRAFLSTERLARIEPFPGAARRVDCPRCKQPIDAGCDAVRCPNPACSRWFHMGDDLPCWS